MRVKFRLIGLDTHAHLTVFIWSSRAPEEREHWIMTGVVTMLATEFPAFREAVDDGFLVQWEDERPEALTASAALEA
jgi:hypothetical protein